MSSTYSFSSLFIFLCGGASHHHRVPYAQSWNFCFIDTSSAGRTCPSAIAIFKSLSSSHIESLCLSVLHAIIIIIKKKKRRQRPCAPYASYNSYEHFLPLSSSERGKNNSGISCEDAEWCIPPHRLTHLMWKLNYNCFYWRHSHLCFHQLRPGQSKNTTTELLNLGWTEKKQIVGTRCMCHFNIHHWTQRSQYFNSGCGLSALTPTRISKAFKPI